MDGDVKKVTEEYLKATMWGGGYDIF
jgi:hypothetical protein